MEDKDALLTEMKNHGVDAAEVEDIERQLSAYASELQSKPSTSAATTDAIDMSVLDDILGNDKRTEESAEEVSSSSSAAPAPQPALSPEEWNQLVQKHIKSPKTTLDQERHQFFSQVEYDLLETAKTEDDLVHFKKLR